MRALTALSIFAGLSFASATLADPPANTIMKVTPPAEKQAPVDAAQVSAS